MRASTFGDTESVSGKVAKGPTSKGRQRPAKYNGGTVPLDLQLGTMTHAAFKNPTRLVGGPGSGKSRFLGRIFAWQLLDAGYPLVILDPNGGVGDNLVDKIMRCPPDDRRRLWQRIVYVDVGATDFIVPSPLYYRLRPNDTLLEIANRFPAVITRIDPALSGAPILGMNALYEAATCAGRIAAALGRQVDFVAGLLERPQQYKSELRAAIAAYPELADAVEYFREMMDPSSAALRERRTGSLRNKLVPILADPTMLASFAASKRGIDWEQVIAEGKTVLLDFRNELDAERRQFKLVWWFRDFIAFARSRNTRGRGSEVFFIIDEITQLLGPPTGSGTSILAQDLNGLLAVLGRGYGVNVVVAHQNLSQVDPSVRNILSQCGNQIIGNITNPDDALYLARQFLRYDPFAEKKREPVWMSVPQASVHDTLLGYSMPEIIDERTVEYSPEEQLLLLAEKFRLRRFEFLVRPASGEGMISNKLYRMSIARLDAGQYPDAEAVQEVLAHLRRKDGIPIEVLLAEIHGRRKSGPESGPGRTATLKHAYPVPLPTREEDDDDPEILREQA